MLYLIGGIILLVTGGSVSVLFWLPEIISRSKLREFLGSRFPLIYLIYIANGPLLFIAGVLLLARYFSFV